MFYKTWRYFPSVRALVWLALEEAGVVVVDSNVVIVFIIPIDGQ